MALAAHMIAFNFKVETSGLSGKSCGCTTLLSVQIFTAHTLARGQGRGAAKKGDDSSAGDRASTANREWQYLLWEEVSSNILTHMKTARRAGTDLHVYMRIQQKQDFSTYSEM